MGAESIVLSFGMNHGQCVEIGFSIARPPPWGCRSLVSVLLSPDQGSGSRYSGASFIWKTVDGWVTVASLV